MRAVLALCLVMPGVALADACADPVTQAEMTACAYADYSRADKELNAAYRAAMDSMFDEQARGLLRTAQRASIPFRDAACASEADQMRGGSMAPMIEAGCLTALTQERTRDLWALAMVR